MIIGCVEIVPNASTSFTDRLCRYGDALLIVLVRIERDVTRDQSENKPKNNSNGKA